MPATSGGPTTRRSTPQAIVYVRIPLEDTNVDLPNAAFDAVRDALNGADGETLLFCAAGLKRAPHLLYGVMRARGHGPQQAWELISQARPMTDRFEPYIAAAERWAATSSSASIARLRPSRPSRSSSTFFPPRAASTASASARKRGRALPSRASPAGVKPHEVGAAVDQGSGSARHALAARVDAA